MGRRVSIVGVALLLAGLLSCRGGAVAADDPPAPPTTPELPTPAASRVAPLELPPIPDEDISAADLHRRAVVVDLHADTLWQLWKKTTPGEAPELPLQASPDRLRAGGVDAQLYPIFVWPQSASPRDVMFQTLEV